MVKEVIFRSADGDERRWHEDVRLYDSRELAQLLSATGLSLVRIEGDFDGRPLDSCSTRQIVWGRKSSA